MASMDELPHKHLGVKRRTTAGGREAGLNMIARANRWLITAAVVSSGALAVVAEHAFHGRTVGSSAASAAQSSAASGEDQGAGLQSPAQAPVAGLPSPTAVVSGGS